MSANEKCSVCEDPAIKENPIVSCIKCDLKVHVYCYGIVGQLENWICSPCRMGKLKFAKCQLCTQKCGALKQTTSDKWVHVICALFTDGVTFMNHDTMEPVDISRVSETKKNKCCAFCYKSVGFCILCSKRKCPNRLHVTCAQKYGAIKEHLNEDDTIKFQAYCKNHRPKETSRRVSSDSVKNVAQKKLTKSHQKQAASDNAAWIMNEIEHQSTPIRKRSSKYLSANRLAIRYVFHLPFAFFSRSRKYIGSRIQKVEDRRVA